MPLMLGKSKRAFGHNVEVELDHERPLKQAVAIAYAQKKKAQHLAHGGDASSHWSACQNCMAEGGNVSSSVREGHSKNNIKGVHQDKAGGTGLSPAGAHARSMGYYEKKGNSAGVERSRGFSKSEHQQVLGEMKSMKKPNLYAQGGEIKASMKPLSAAEKDKAIEDKWDNEKYDLNSVELDYEDPESDYAKGGYIPNPTEAQARSGYAVSKAEGGEIDSDGDYDGDGDDDQMMDMVADELMSALESKNKKEILEAIRAIVLSCK